MALNILDNDTIQQNITLGPALIDLAEQAYITMTHSEVIIPEIQQLLISANIFLPSFF